MAENDEKQNNRQTADVTASSEGEAALPETNTTKQKVLKALQIAGDVLFCLIIAFALFVLIISVSAKRDADGTANVFGYQLRFVRSGSMEKCDQTDVSGYKIKSIPVEKLRVHQKSTRTRRSASLKRVVLGVKRGRRAYLSVQ